MKINFKKLLVGLSLFVTGFFCLSPIVTFADVNKNTATEDKGTVAGQNEQISAQSLKTYQNLGEGMYAITWPLIMIAGKFMENDVIYGSFIGMDVLLWKIWNIMRTFANYIIGIILIFSIFTLFLGGKFEQFNPIKIIPQLVISSLLVNASWFIMGACLDLSTILTYSVGTLPLNIAGKELHLNDRKIPKFAIEFQNDENPVKVGVKNGKDGPILPFCEMSALTGDTNGVKVFPKNTDTNGCAYACGTGYYAVTAPVEIPEQKEVKCKELFKDEVKGLKSFGEVMAKNPGMSTILGTLYASIVNIGQLSSSTTGTTSGMMTDLLFKLIFLFALVIPLFTFALIMIARAVVLWMFIIISPIIFLFTSIKGVGDKLLGEKGTLKEMCCMVFLPVTVTFALSISFVFLSVLNFTTLKENFGIEGKGNEVYIQTDGNPEHKIIIKYKDTGVDSALTNLFGVFQNTMLWIIKLMFAIGFMWILVFTALKSCKITSGIAIFVGNFAKQMAKAAPIIPVAGGQSIASLGQGLSALKDQPGIMQGQQRENLENMFGEMMGKDKEKKAIETASNNLSTIPKVTANISSSMGKDVSYKVGNKTTTKKTGDFTNNELLSNDSALQAVAAQIGIDSNVFRKILEAQKKAGKGSAKLSSEQALIEAKIKEEKLRKVLRDDLLGKNITIDQLDKSAKQIIYDLFAKSAVIKTKPTLSEIKAESAKLAQALKEFGFNDEEIKKLIAKNLIGSKLNKADLDRINKLIKGLK